MMPLLPTMERASPRKKPPTADASNTALLFTESCAEFEIDPKTVKASVPALSQKEALDQVAKATGQPRARIIRQAIDAFLRHFEELRGNRP